MIRSTCFLVLVCVLGSGSLPAQTLSQRLASESTAKLAQQARQDGDAVAGAILFTRPDLKCTICHDTQASNPIGPDLRGPREATDTHLVESLLFPSKVMKEGFESVQVLTTSGQVLIGRIVKQDANGVVLREASTDAREVTLRRSEIDRIAKSQVSTMPKGLVDQLASRKQFLDLVRYLMELRSSESNRSDKDSRGVRELSATLQGVALLKELNCAACHEDDVVESRLEEKQAPDLLRTINRVTPSFVEDFIAAPHLRKPGTSMPDVLASFDQQERRKTAKQITHYLTSLATKPLADQPIDVEAAERGKELFHQVGCVACHSPRDHQGRETLASTSVPLGPVSAKYVFAGLVEFLKDPLESHPSGRMPSLNLTHWEANDIASYLLQHNQKQSAPDRFEVDAALASEGRLQFHRLGCQRCHHTTGTDDSSSPSPVPLKSLSQVRVGHGCLSDPNANPQGQTARRSPVFDLSQIEWTAIANALRQPQIRLGIDDEIDLALTALRCVRCHQRDDLGGVGAERNPHFHTSDPNLGPQGRLPPPLTHVGAKLNPKWLRQVLVSGRSIRPYVRTRMPQYGAENVTFLIDLFRQSDQLPKIEFGHHDDVKDARKVGAELTGNQGLNCIACHTFQLKSAANMSAVDLTEMVERLQKPWFYHYMLDPQRYSPNTIMPSFWPDGRAMRHDIMDGKTDQQIEALWLYLSEGRQARPPRGLIYEPMELVATDEAVMLRRAYPEIGKRGIGVGFPSQVNLAWDAEQMRLALIWQGKFADPAGVWRSQGHGRVRPLGEKPLSFTRGPDLDFATNPWIVDDGRPPNHQFKGYTLDEKRRPRFRYRFDSMPVTDYTVDRIDPADERPYLLRTIEIESRQARRDLVFRAASGRSIELLSSGEYRIDDRLSVEIVDLDNAGQPRIEDADDQSTQRLLVPLSIQRGTTTLTLKYRW